MSAGPLFSAKGRFLTFIPRLKYDPSDACSKPKHPYGNDRYVWDSCRADAAEYVSCLREAAKADMDYAVGVIADGYKEKLGDFSAELERGY